jgi:cysteine-rich repeat protein
MSLVTSLQSHRKAILGASVAIIALGLFLTLQKPAMGKAIPFEKNGIPIPFLESYEGSNLKGAVTFYDKRNNIDVYSVTFNAGEVSETIGEDQIYLVSIPNDATITEKDFDAVMRQATGGRDVNYYGYQYTDALATTERLNINSANFTTRFPGQFFASEKARAEDSTHGNGIQQFETQHNLSFRHTNGTLPKSTLKKNALYVLITNEAGASSTKIFPKGAPALCGDGAREGTEICDDGNQVNTDACKNDCTANTGSNPICGNGVKEGTEACDDGNTNNADSCSSTCTVNAPPPPPPVCGNGTREGTEQCDDGNSVNTDACKNDCTSNTGSNPICRNGVKEGNEACDDGDVNDNNLCKNDCTTGLPVPFSTEPTTTPPTVTPPTTVAPTGVEPTTVPPVVTPPTTIAPTTVNPPSEDLVFTALQVPSVKGVVFPQVPNQPIETFSRFSVEGNGTLRKIEFVATQGSIPMGYDYRLWKDTNGDGAVDLEMSVRATDEESATLIFPLTNEIVATSTPVTFELRGLPQATGLLQISIGGSGNSVTGESCAQALCTVGILRTNTPTLFAFSSHGSAPSPYALTVEQIATSISTINANESTTIFSFKATAHIYDESDVALKALKFKVVSGVPTDARYELWYDTNNDGVPETPWSVLGVVDPQTKIVTFGTENGTIPGYLMDGRAQRYDIRVIHDPVAASNNTEFKMTFAITDPAYVTPVKAIDGDYTNAQPITGVRTNNICSGTCTIDVTEVPSTTARLNTTTSITPLCGNSYKEGNEQCDNDRPISATSQPNSGDGCSSTCTSEPDFTCTGTHPSVCTPVDNPLCGDSGDGCSATCTVEAPHYSCDGPVNGPSVCHLCGDGVVNLATEECDDQNQLSGDGCSDACVSEPHYSCEENTQGVSVCYQCGDKSIKIHIEECDDGNIINGDGCPDDCSGVEEGFACGNTVDQATGNIYSVCSGGNGGGNTAVCGNGTREGAEGCDNGAQNALSCTPQNGQPCTYCSSATCQTVTVQPTTVRNDRAFVQALARITDADIASTNSTARDSKALSLMLSVALLELPSTNLIYDVNGDGTVTAEDTAIIFTELENIAPSN